jgi:hypothetical protein
MHQFQAEGVQDHQFQSASKQITMFGFPGHEAESFTTPNSLCNGLSSRPITSWWELLCSVVTKSEGRVALPL